MFVFHRDKNRILNVLHMMYDHHSSYLCLPDRNNMSIMFDMSSMLIVVYVCVVPICSYIPTLLYDISSMIILLCFFVFHA